MRCKILIFIIVAIFFTLGILPSGVVYAANNYNIDATVKISVCGNGVVEGGEDCDGMNLNGKTCQNLKYEQGILSCDVSCSFDASQCIAATSTTTQKQTQMPTQAQSSFLAPTIIPTVVSSHARITSFWSILPSALHIFDINKNGHITTSELPDVLKMWILSWKNYSKHKECDLVRNGTCDMKDLSVLLYYVNR